MLTSLLQACGLYLGRQRDMLPAAPDNPDGFWENRSFLRINERLLKELGGAWHRPPANRSRGWELEARWKGLQKEAGKLIKRWQGREPWGWKDPRNCLTLPFWKRIIPGMKVLICVRNPLAVAQSLGRRNGFSFAYSFDLWLTYNQSLLQATSPAQRRIVSCENIFFDPQPELRRVLKWLHIPVTREVLSQASRRINPSLIHHRQTMDDLRRAGAPTELMRCYRDLLLESTSTRKRSSSARRTARASTARVLP